MLSEKLILISGKIMLGVTLAAPIGPVSVEMIKRGLKSGFWSAFSVRLGGAIGNTLCLVATYVGLSQVMGRPLVMNVLGLLGSLLLIYMGISTLVRHAVIVDLSANNNNVPHHNGLLWGFYLSVISPVTLVFWPSIFAASMNAEGSISIEGFLLNLFVIAGVLIWGAVLSLTLAFGNRILNKTTINILTKIAALLMIFYGLKYAFYVYMRL